MHRSALARGAAVYFSVQLREHGAQAAALADVMGVGSVGANHIILLFQIGTNSGGYRLLADAEMGRAAHVPLRIERLNALFDPSHAQHGTIECKARLLRLYQRRVALWSGSSQGARYRNGHTLRRASWVPGVAR